MINYEVNLEIDASRYETFLPWLSEHINELLCFEGFKKAQVFEDTSSSSCHKITVQYEIDTIENLQAYFDNHAKTMRDKTTSMFGDTVKASRRILKLNKVFKQ